MATATRTSMGEDWLVAPEPLPLENGDHLTRYEFERRYDSMPELKHAELIEGVVYMGSSVHYRRHGEPHSSVITWLGVYRASTPAVGLGDNATVRLDPDNDAQPDALLRLEPAAGGRSSVSGDDYIEGPPELVVEVAASSASYDMHDKLRAYRRNGVQEYLVWRVYDRQIDWWELREGVYAPLPPDERGLLASRVFPGLWLDPAALLRGDLAAVLAALGQGLQSPAHAAFVARLKGTPA